MASDRLGDAGPDGFGIGPVDDDGRGAVGRDARVGDGGIARRIGARLIAARQDDSCALLQIAPHDLLAEIAGGTGNQRDLAGETA